MDQAVEKGAGRDHHRPDLDYFVQGGADATDLFRIEKNFVNDRLADLQVRLIFQHLLHPQPVEQAVGLGP
jgi:hypothetical protein